MRKSRATSAAILTLLASACAHGRNEPRYTLLAPMAAPGDHSTPQPVISSAPGEHLTARTALDCPLTGRWQTDTPDLGRSTLSIELQPDGRNRTVELGRDDFEGSAEMRGHVLQIVFRARGGAAGHYEWTLDQACLQGSGKLVFHTGGHEEHASTVQHLR
ncbi:MAG: hypothetical protein JWN04_5642 [Myxococcaceae bacterium]|nr:hypothetical protein [Myxococcaceae bacterium]